LPRVKTVDNFKFIEVMGEKDPYPEGLHGREGGPFSLVVKDGEKIFGVLWIVVC
jgi:hypothetical protein